MSTNRYIYNHEIEPARQSSQAKIMHDQSLALLQQAGLQAGSSIVDFGCGTADIDFSIAQAVGPVGKVLGVDCNPGIISLNQKRKAQAQTDNLSFRIGLAENYSDIFLYDITFARFLMAHAQNPASLLTNMLTLTKNYGYIVVEDVDLKTMTATPYSPELEVLKTLVSALIHYNGGDASIGPQLGTLMNWVGIQKIQWFEHQPTGTSGPIKQVPLRVLEAIQQSLVQIGLATPEQIVKLHQGLQRLAEDDGTTIYFPTIYQAIGYNSRNLKFGPARYI